MQDSQFRVWYVFLIQVIAIAGVLQWLGKMEPMAQFDTTSYRDYSLEYTIDALNDKRTFVYPCVLQLFVSADGSERLIPWFQYLLSAVSVGVFLASLLRCAWNPWLALAAASPILTSQMVLEYSGVLTPDLLAQSFAVLTISQWFIVLHTGRSPWALVGMSTFLFLAYQTKPSYLFLLAFAPIGGWIARWWLNPDTRDAWRVALRITLASLLPFLAWSTLRWFVVGHFGLVSFGGYNIIGIAGQFLQKDWTPQLSSDVQTLAVEILKQREGKRDWNTELNYDNMELHFNPMVWDIAVPAASKLYEADSRVMNRQMARLSSEIILVQPKSYATWLWMASKRSIRAAIELTLRNPIAMLSIPLMLGAFAVRWRRKGIGHEQGKRQEYEREFQMMLWTALGYAMCKMALVILVEPPIERYCAPASVFWPSILTMIACRMILQAIATQSGTRVTYCLNRFLRTSGRLDN